MLIVCDFEGLRISSAKQPNRTNYTNCLPRMFIDEYSGCQQYQAQKLQGRLELPEGQVKLSDIENLKLFLRERLH